MDSVLNDQSHGRGSEDWKGDSNNPDGGSQQEFRPIVPGPPWPDETKRASATSKRNLGDGWKRRVSTACLACKKSKRKCSGTPPCDNCRALSRECVFDETLDQRRRVAAKRTAEELEYHREMLNDLFKVIRTADEKQAQRLLDMIRSDATPEEIRVFTDELLAHLQALEPPSKAKQETAERLQELRSRANMQGSAPSFRRQVMDVNFLCVVPPIEVPASPWTTVTDDDAFVSHLVSLYFTWDYPFYSFLDMNVLIRHMKSRDLSSDFCSPFLVNALLAHACSYSEYSEAYDIPGDITSKGARFLKEAEMCLERRKDDLSLSTLQGTMILYERYSMTGQDDLGYAMLYKAIDIVERLGCTGGTGQDIDLSKASPDVYNSAVKTVWGLFQLDTVAHTGFLKPCRIKNVRLSRSPSLLGVERDADEWLPYPSQKPPRKAYFVTYFEKACALSEISRDISTTLFSDKMNGNKERLSAAVDSLYLRMREWYESLPEEFDVSRKPAPHMLLLQIRYHTMLISMFNCPRGHNDQAKSTELDTTSQTRGTTTRAQGTEKEDSVSIAISSARSIARLIRVHQEEYGISRSHVFTLFAVNLALFLLLDLDAFDISDRDCASLTSAFSIITTRSILGHEVRSIFRRSVSRLNEAGHSKWDLLPEGLQAILADDASSSSSSSSSSVLDSDSDDGGDGDGENHRGSKSKSSNVKNVKNDENEAQPRDKRDERDDSGTGKGASRRKSKTKKEKKKKRRQDSQVASERLCEMLCLYETMTLGRTERLSGQR